MRTRWGRVQAYCSDVCSKAAATRALYVDVALASTVLAVLAIVFVLTFPWATFYPHKEPHYADSLDGIGNRDIIFKDVIAHNDGYQTEVGVEIVLTNRGKGSTGPLYIDVFAENQTSHVIDSTFNTSTLRYLDNGTTGSIIPPEKSAKINGMLLLRPGTHLIYIRIYEDGLRGYIEGQRTLTVTEDQIVLQPWQSDGGSRASSLKKPSGGLAPGFEAVWLLGALIAVVIVRKIKSKK